MDDLTLVLITGPLSALVGALVGIYAQSLKEWFNRPILKCYCSLDDNEYYLLNVENEGKSTAECVDIHISYVDPMGCGICDSRNVDNTYINPHSNKVMVIGQSHPDDDTLIVGGVLPKYADLIITVSAKGLVEKELKLNVVQFVKSNLHTLSDKNRIVW